MPKLSKNEIIEFIKLQKILKEINHLNTVYPTLNELENVNAARNNLGLGTLATQSGTFYQNKSCFINGTDYASINGNRRVRTIGASGNFRFSFSFPLDMHQLISLKLIILPNNTITGANIDLHSEYAQIGELSTNHLENNTNLSYYLVSNQLYGINLMTVFTLASAGDIAGLLVTNIGVTGGYDCIGILMEYI